RLNAKRGAALPMAEAFDALRLDGKRLDGVEAYRHFDPDRAKGRKDIGYRQAIQQEVEELMLSGTGSLTASTSGTTGPPKRMRIPRSNLVHSSRLTAHAFDLQAGDRVLLCLPCAYIAGKM